MKKILVISDTLWQEAEISQKSSVFMMDQLRKVWYDVQQGFWDMKWGISPVVLENIDLAIPVIHGVPWEDGQVTKFFQQRGIPILFSDVQVHQLCIDKHKTKQVLWTLDFCHSVYSTVLPWSLVLTDASQNIEVPSSVEKLFVKPNNGGSSLDSGIFDTLSDAENLITKILDYDTVLVEEYIADARELTVALAGDYDKDVEVLGIMEILTDRAFFDYQAKYEWIGTKEIFPDLDLSFEQYLKSISVEIYKKLKIKTFARIDYLYKDNILYFLEINTIPWMTEKSFFPQCVECAGYPSFGEFMQKFIE